MIVLNGVAGQAAQRDIAAAVVRFGTSSALGMAGADVPSSLRTASEALAAQASAIAVEPADYGEALLTAWRVLAVEGNAVALPGVLRDALAEPVESAAGQLERIAIAAAYALAVLRPAYGSQQDGRRAREMFAAAVGPVLQTAAPLFGADMTAWLSDITGQAARELSAISATRSPLVRVETPASASAIRLAYDLYGDAGRDGELVARNRSGTPAMMPVTFEALSR